MLRLSRVQAHSKPPGIKFWPFIAAFLVFLTTSCALAQGITVRKTDSEPATRTVSNGALVLIDNKIIELDTLEVVRGQQAMIWIREIETKLKWGVVESAGPVKTVFRSNNVKLTFIKDQGIALVNSLAVKLPIDTYYRNDRLMVPLSLVAKSLGHKYKLSYKVVIDIDSSTALPEPVTNDNKMETGVLSGQVQNADKNLEGIVLHLIDPEYRVVRENAATTDRDGQYEITGLKKGKYRVYAYVEENPDYFNRVSEVVDIEPGKTTEASPLKLVKLVRPGEPEPGKEIEDKSENIDVSWTGISTAKEYLVTVANGESGDVITDIKTEKTSITLKKELFDSGTIYVITVTARGANDQIVGKTAGKGGVLWTFSLAD